MGLAFLISTDKLQLLGERKVLKEKEYVALLDATALVDVARKEAQRIGQQAAQDAQQTLRHGFEEGVKRAKAEQAQHAIGEGMAAERQLQALRGAIANIVVKAVAQFMEEADPSALLETTLRRIDLLIRAEPFVTMRVSPSGERALRDALARLADEAPWTPRVSLSADPALSPGACVVQTASGSLEIGIDAQLEAFRRAVAQDALHAPGKPR